MLSVGFWDRDPGTPANRPPPRPARGDAPLALLALVVVVGFVGFVTQIARFPQITGVEIKASYLLFIAPCFALFSVAAWLALARWKRKVGIALVAVATLYVLSYGTSLASTLTMAYDPQLQIAVPHGYVDLQLALEAHPVSQIVGSEVDYDLSITNVGTMSAGRVVLEVDLPPGMTLLGAPYYERGPGSRGRARSSASSTSFPPA